MKEQFRTVGRRGRSDSRPQRHLFPLIGLEGSLKYLQVNGPDAAEMTAVPVTRYELLGLVKDWSRRTFDIRGHVVLRQRPVLFREQRASFHESAGLAEAGHLRGRLSRLSLRQLLPRLW